MNTLFFKMRIMDLKLVLSSFALILGAAAIDDELAKQNERTDHWPKDVGVTISEELAQIELVKRAVDNDSEERADSDSVFREEDKQTDRTVIRSKVVTHEKSGAANIVIRIEKGSFNNLASIRKENASLENGTLPDLICWEIKCPDCSKLETPRRCFGRAVLTGIVRSIFFLLALALLACCVCIVNHKGKSMMKQANEKIKLVGDIENGDNQIDEDGDCKQALKGHNPT